MTIHGLEAVYGVGRGGYICSGNQQQYNETSTSTSTSTRSYNRTNSYFTVGWTRCKKKELLLENNNSI
jgi:aconitase B